MRKITEREIKEKLAGHYGRKENNMGRPLIKKLIQPSKMFKTIIYALKGSPPKGYALYIKEIDLLSLYDLNGRRWRILRNTEVIENE